MKMETTFKKRDGSANFEGEISAKIIKLDAPVLVLIVVRDVTERIKTHQE
jgi:hypothetical protein